MLSKLVPLGNIGIEARAVRERLGFSPPTDGAELLGVAPAAPPVALNRAVNRSGSLAIDAETEMDLLAQDVMDEWEEILSPLVNPVQALAERCESFEEFEQGLSDLLLSGEIDEEKLMASLAEASFRARGLGDVEG